MPGSMAKTVHNAIYIWGSFGSGQAKGITAKDLINYGFVK